MRHMSDHEPLAIKAAQLVERDLQSASAAALVSIAVSEGRPWRVLLELFTPECSSAFVYEVDPLGDWSEAGALADYAQEIGSVLLVQLRAHGLTCPKCNELSLDIATHGEPRWQCTSCALSAPFGELPRSSRHMEFDF